MGLLSWFLEAAIKMLVEGLWFHLKIQLGRDDPLPSSVAIDSIQILVVLGLGASVPHWLFARVCSQFLALWASFILQLASSKHAG